MLTLTQSTWRHHHYIKMITIVQSSQRKTCSEDRTGWLGFVGLQHWRFQSSGEWQQRPLNCPAAGRRILRSPPHVCRLPVKTQSQHFVCVILNSASAFSPLQTHWDIRGVGPGWFWSSFINWVGDAPTASCSFFLCLVLLWEWTQNKSEPKRNIASSVSQ